MAERNGEVRAQTQAHNKILLKKYSQIEIEVIDDADYHTVVGMTNVENAKAVDLATAVDVTVTVLGNVVTVDDAGVSGDHILITVVGT